MSALRRMTNRLVRKSPVPLYSQVKDLLRERIARQRDEEHDQLPSERELARDLGVSRMTVRQATRELIAEGAIYTAPGRGTFLAPGEVTQQLVGLTSFSQEMTKRGLVPSSRILESGMITDREVAARLQIGADEPIVRIRRLRLADDEPMALESTHLPMNRFPGLLAIDLERQSLYEVLQSAFRIRFGTATQTIAAESASSAEATMLGLQPGDAILVMERTTLLADGKPIEFVRSWYRGDRYHFAVQLGTRAGRN
jgi:GntR family transcriptional regulator